MFPNPQRSKAHAIDAPKPNSSHRAFEEYIEAGINHVSEPIGEEKQEDASPGLIALAAAAQHGGENGGSPPELDDDPERQAGNTSARQEHQMGIVRAAQGVVFQDRQSIRLNSSHGYISS